jgi:hypothetical protein
MSLSPARVQAALDAWRWVPDRVRRVSTEEFDAIEFPDDFAPSMQVHLGQVERSPTELIQTVTNLADEWGSQRLDGGSPLTRRPSMRQRSARYRAELPKSSTSWRAI